MLLAAPAAADAGTLERIEDGGLRHAVGGADARPGSRSTAVVIDVLRATTTLTEARANGAARVIPAATVSEALALCARHPGALLCGERDGRIIKGFDLGNSPFEYGPARVAGRTLIFASTNGSQALRLASGARRTLLGAFLNATAAAERAAADDEVWLLASGRLGWPCLEDLACAGWIARSLIARGFPAQTPEARLVAALAPSDAAGVRALVEGAAQARRLGALGGSFARDVGRCATLDAVTAVWEFSDRA